jgi:hypothetical protein
MCTPADAVSIALFFAFVGCGIRAFVLQKQFAKSLRASDPATWKLIKVRKWSEDSELRETSVMLFVLDGAFRALPQPELVELGAACRKWYFGSMIVLFALGALANITQHAVPPSCIWR